MNEGETRLDVFSSAFFLITELATGQVAKIEQMRQEREHAREEAALEKAR